MNKTVFWVWTVWALLTITSIGIVLYAACLPFVTPLSIPKTIGVELIAVAFGWIFYKSAIAYLIIATKLLEKELID